MAHNTRTLNMGVDLEQIQASLTDRWKDSFSSVLDTMAGIKPEVPSSAAAEEEETIGMLWWRQDFEGVQGGSVWLGSPSHTWTRLGQLVLSGAGIEAAPEADIRDSYLEVLKQVFVVFARALASALGQEVTCSAGREQSAPPDAPGSWIGVRPPNETLPPVQIQFSREILEAVLRHARAGEPADDLVSADAGDALVQAETWGGEEPELSARARRTLDVLLDVEMPVHVSFGKTRVRMQDVLKFVNGAVIELDRAISEPVEILVNNCVIARGAVVVVDGNYGVQINEVASRRERLQQSRRFMLPARVSGSV